MSKNRIVLNFSVLESYTPELDCVYVQVNVTTAERKDVITKKGLQSKLCKPNRKSIAYKEHIPVKDFKVCIRKLLKELED